MTRKSPSKPVRMVYIVGACISGHRQYVTVRATSEASARIKAAHTFNCKYGTELSPFELRLE